MNPSNTLGKNALNYGIVAGLVLIVYSLFLYFFDLMFYKPFLLNNVVGALIVVVFMIIGTKHLRDAAMHGSMSYGKAFLSAFLIGLFAMIISLIFNNVLTYLIDPGIREKAFEYSAEQMIKKGRITQEQVEAVIEQQKQMSSKLWVILIGQFFALLGVGIINAIIALIVAAFLKKEGDTFADAMQEVTPEENR
ncbi:MAG: DUF4199 domain-containing protein [Bacteroidales bacterium]|jgi:hypothetical protein|nr:DUF4199 domain-containing protein [Bacteroidales bacterium]